MRSHKETPAQPIHPEHEKQIRAFYDTLMNKLETQGWIQNWHESKLELLDAVEQLNNDAENVCVAHPVKSSPITFTLRNSGPKEGQEQTVHSSALMCGRFSLCDCVIGHDVRNGAACENLLVGRIQFILIRTASDVVVIDCWSKCGTKTVERSFKDRPLQTSSPGSRRLLMFSSNESFTLEIGGTARITFQASEPS